MACPNCSGSKSCDCVDYKVIYPPSPDHSVVIVDLENEIKELKELIQKLEDRIFILESTRGCCKSTDL